MRSRVALLVIIAVLVVVSACTRTPDPSAGPVIAPAVADMTAALAANKLPVADLFDLTRRLKGRDGISRALYVTAVGRRVVVVRVFVKKTQTTPSGEIELALKRAKEIRE